MVAATLSRDCRDRSTALRRGSALPFEWNQRARLSDHSARRRRGRRPEAPHLPLERDGYRVVQARDGEEALRPVRARARRPRRARHHASEARRPRGLQAPARDEPGADHHAHRARRRARQGASGSSSAPTTTSRSRSRSASSGAVCGRSCGARRRRADRRRARRSRSTGCASTSPGGRSKCAGEPSSSPTSSSSSCGRCCPPGAGLHAARCCSSRSGATPSYRDPRTIDVHVRHLREKLEARSARAGVHPDGARRRLPLPRPMSPFRSVGARLSLALLARRRRRARDRLLRRRPVAPAPADHQQARPVGEVADAAAPSTPVRRPTRTRSRTSSRPSCPSVDARRRSSRRVARAAALAPASADSQGSHLAATSRDDPTALEAPDELRSQAASSSAAASATRRWRFPVGGHRSSVLLGSGRLARRRSTSSSGAC